MFDDFACVKNTVVGMMYLVLVCLSCPASSAHFIYVPFFFPVDIISAIEFNRTGDHLATGDRGGRVVLFERTDTRDVCLLIVFLFMVLKLCFFTHSVAPVFCRDTLKYSSLTKIYFL